MIEMIEIEMIDTETIETLKENLAPDAEAFRKMTGLAFKNWSI